MKQSTSRTSFPAAIRMIRMEHARLLACFQRLKADSSPPVREAICRNICRMLDTHNRLEEELFYPALRECGLHQSTLERSVKHHADMRLQMERVTSLGEHGQDQTAALTALIAAVLRHVAEEEAHVLPAAESLMGSQRLKVLGARMTRKRFELNRTHAVEMATDMARSAPLTTALFTAGTLLASGFVARHFWPQSPTKH
ncbi:MAG: cation-binding protein [Comamonadaceae bacterium]|nr:cation-binding protein [Comamonadaceae bacterium]